MYAGQTSSGSSAYGHNLDVVSNYSYTKSTKANQSEATIDIHIKYLKLKVPQKTVLHIVWSRGKKHARTQSKILSGNVDKAVFEEKFQINTLLELDQETGMPLKEKISKMTVVLDKSMGETPIAEAEFNMADFNYGEYKPVKLYLKKCSENDYVDVDTEQCYLDIGLKGTRARHFQVDRKPSGNPFKNSKTLGLRQQHEESGDIGGGSLIDRQSSNSALINQEMDRLKKENKQIKKDHAREVTQKNTKINNLFTEIENLKTDLSYTQSEKQKLTKSVQGQKDEFSQVTDQLNETQGQLDEKEKKNEQLNNSVQELKDQNDLMKQTNEIQKDEQQRLKEEFDQQISFHYSFNRFDTDFVTEEAISLYKMADGMQ